MIKIQHFKSKKEMEAIWNDDTYFDLHDVQNKIFDIDDGLFASVSGELWPEPPTHVIIDGQAYKVDTHAYVAKDGPRIDSATYFRFDLIPISQQDLLKVQERQTNLDRLRQAKRISGFAMHDEEEHARWINDFCDVYDALSTAIRELRDHSKESLIGELGFDGESHERLYNLIVQRLEDSHIDDDIDIVSDNESITFTEFDTFAVVRIWERGNLYVELRFDF